MAKPGATRVLKVASARSLQQVLTPFGTTYEKATGTPVEFFFGPVGTVQQHLDGGAAADVIILSEPLIAAYVAAGKLVPASCRPIGRVGIMLVVREGASAPDISTPEAFKAALLAASAIACSDPAIGGSAGTHFAALLKRLDVEDAVREKLVKCASGAKTAEAVAAGEAEVGVTLLPEVLPVKGTRPAAPLPDALQKYTTYVAAVAMQSELPEAAAAFIDATSAPAQAPAWRAAGVEPL